jgi:hypothetical protein
LAASHAAKGLWPEFEASPLWKLFEDTSEQLGNRQPIDSKKRLDAILREVFPVQCFVLSDTIVIISDAALTDQQRFLGIEVTVAFARQLHTTCFLNGIPLRGALAYGECYTDEERSIYFGRALLEAMALEKAQEWIGCAICDSACAVVQEYFRERHRRGGPLDWKMTLFGPMSQHSVHAYPVPLKGRDPENRLVINWAGAIIGRVNIHEHLFDKVLTGNPSIDVKYKNTLAYLVW